MERTPAGVRYKDLCKVCDHFFGKARQKGTSHRSYPLKKKGRPPLNLQPQKGMAKRYQVIQVLMTIKELGKDNEKFH